MRSTLRLSLTALLLAVLGCRHLESAAARDPMRCERDPSCTQKRSGTFDCSTQCADDPACIDRCREVEVSAGTTGR